MSKKTTVKTNKPNNILPRADQEPLDFFVATYNENCRMRDLALLNFSYQAAARFQSMATAAYEKIPRGDIETELSDLSDGEIVSMLIEQVEELPLEAVQDIFIAIADRLNYPLKPRLVNES